MGQISKYNQTWLWSTASDCPNLIFIAEVCLKWFILVVKLFRDCNIGKYLLFITYGRKMTSRICAQYLNLLPPPLVIKLIYCRHKILDLSMAVMALMDEP